MKFRQMNGLGHDSQRSVTVKGKKKAHSARLRSDYALRVGISTTVLSSWHTDPPISSWVGT
jgi:hypothetical protein